MPDKLTKAQFIQKAQAGEFDSEPWYTTAVKALFSPIPAVQDRASDLAYKLDPEHSQGVFGIEDIPKGLAAIPDVVKNLSGYKASSLQDYIDTLKATIKGGTAGVIQGIGDNITPLDAVAPIVGKVAKDVKPVSKLIDKAGQAIEGVTKGKLSLEERIANLFKDDPLHPSTASVTPSGIDSRISGVLDNPAISKGVGVDHPSPVRQTELASGRPTIKPKLATDTDTRVKELLDKLGGTQTSTVSAAADEPWLHDTVRPRSAELDAFTSPSSGRLQSEGVRAGRPETTDYVSRVLGKVAPKGPAGLEITDSTSSIPTLGKIKNVVYRGADGTPITVARVIMDSDGKSMVMDMASDKTKGLLHGRGVKAVGEYLRAHGMDVPAGTVTPDAVNLIEKAKKY